jgi:hypothetical protein
MKRLVEGWLRLGSMMLDCWPKFVPWYFEILKPEAERPTALRPTALTPGPNKGHVFNPHQIDPPEPFHYLYRVTLKNIEIWAVDTTGAQYGYADLLCPWRDFEQHRSGKINRECEFGYIRHQVYQSYGMFPARHIVAQKIEKQELTKATWREDSCIGSGAWRQVERHIRRFGCCLQASKR